MFLALLAMINAVMTPPNLSGERRRRARVSPVVPKDGGPMQSTISSCKVSDYSEKIGAKSSSS